jgi:hypothetical protein
MGQPVSHINWIEKIGPTEYRGMLSYEIPSNQTQTEIDRLWFTQFPGVTGDSPPICKRPRAVIEPMGMAGKTLIEAYFESLRVPGRAKLDVDVQAKRTIPLLFDLHGAAIQGVGYGYADDGTEIPNDPSNPAAGATFIPATNTMPRIWRVVSGDPYMQVFTSPMVLSTAFWTSGFSLGNVYALCPGGRPRVNAQPITLNGFGTIAAESLLCRGAKAQVIFGYDMVDVSYILDWSGPDQTWNELTQSQSGKWQAVRAPEYDAETGDEIENRQRTHMMFVPDGNPPEPRVIYPNTNLFSQLQGLQIW